MRRPRPSITIRARITILIFSFSAGLLLLTAIAVHVVFDRQLGHNLDDTLQLQTVAGIELVDVTTSPATLRVQSDPENQRANGEAHLRLYGGDGQLLTDMSPVTSGVAAEQYLVTQALQTGVAQIQTMDLSDNEDYRVLATPIRAGDAVVAVLVTGIERNRVSQPLAILRWTLYVSLPLTALALAIGGYVISRRALAPVAAMTSTAQRIASSRGRHRIEGDESRDELGELARTLNEMLDQLHNAVDRERRFAADASHELRTPLAAIEASIDVTLSQKRDATDYRHALVVVDQQTRRLLRLSTQLLLLSRLDAAAVSEGFVSIDLVEFFGAVVESFQSRYPRATISLDAGNNPLEIWGDVELLGRAFLNIIDNSAIHGGPDVAVSIYGVKRGSGAIAVIIGDNGSGIDHHLAPELFHRFRRGEASRHRDGTGLGLSIVEAIFRSHGGAIRLMPPQQNSGARFEITLPGA